LALADLAQDPSKITLRLHPMPAAGKKGGASDKAKDEK
jgi:hypothetical protein